MTAEVRLVDADELRRRYISEGYAPLGEVVRMLELVEAVADAIRQADYECEMAESVQLPVASWTEHQARAVLSVPALRDALARDAQVRELDRMMAADGATGIDLWRWESGDGWCAESDLCRSVIAEGATPSEALADLARQAKEVLGQ